MNPPNFRIASSMIRHIFVFFFVKARSSDIRKKRIYIFKMSVEATHPHKEIIDRFFILAGEMRQERCGKRDAEIFIFEAFRMVALKNDIDVLNAIWTHSLLLCGLVLLDMWLKICMKKR